ncbi:helix-turn-helix domain-containing protein [Yersinia alsatica]|uniref:Helix-turn-helix domain-containing protein n=1 Tax=Yersinia alsatica TaxID=2890317 RepID=A0ABY5UKR8_9GAMM|nr:helix-turn-helix transcriptional regulator [Yersinia alsatica]OWF68625.1 transcriptional regulator [Yersinia frederiksenii]UWM44084.1 helix-turn-helix domain-containing protein [Yersinia alsatica]CNK95642.1 putative transcriptional regulator Nlp [Yersinia frederiksenii]CNL12464.1 putative transcriptional regulator Nlp [Yersinia frederiksenii]
MNNSLASQKKRTKGSQQDWHRADIVAALHKRGLTLSQLSRDQGLAARTLNNAFERHYPRAENLIAQALGVTPEEIWPSRYHGKKAKRILE